MLLPVGGYFIYCARGKEANMLELFPEQYAAFMARTGCSCRGCSGGVEADG